jgi:XRE family aerobic/anaerobic benzoate catabolism transcriptional regulator
VAAQGDRRPIEASSDAMTELRQLLEQRAPLYAQCEIAVDTSGRLPEEVADLVQAELTRRGAAA